MTQQHPIEPPPGLIDQLKNDALHGSRGQYDYESRLVMAGYAAGADQELEACCKWTAIVGGAEALRAARRPQPTDKELVLRVLVENGVNLDGRMELDSDDIAILTRALEALPND